MNAQSAIATVEFAGTAPGPQLLISGGVHGDEFEPIAAVRELIRRFRKPDGDASLRAGRLTLAPLANPSAFLLGARTGSDGLDLARVCPGKLAGSPTEQAAHALSQLIRAADHYIDLHAGGAAFRVLPMSGYTLHPDERILERQRSMARAFNLPVVWGTAATLEGRSLSVARDAGVAAIYAEYQGGGACDPRGVAAYVDGSLNVMRLLGMIDGELPVSQVERTVEDPRPDSGHMQICNPAPIGGFFEPAVELGAPIRASDLIGTVCDPLGDSSRAIHSTQTGLVLVLRCLSRVGQGESVGVILENAE